MDEKEKRKEHVHAWKHRKVLRAFNDDKMKLIDESENQPITEPFKLKKNLIIKYKKREEILAHRKVQQKNLNRLKNIPVKNARQMMFKEQLATIFEESNHSLDNIEQEIRDLET